jgi:hypothetical protein
MRLKVEDWALSICKISEASVPAWAHTSRFINFCRTPEEHSLVCESHYVPEGIKAESGWRCMRVVGVLDFSQVGIIAGIAQTLAARKISIFTLSTYDTDYILIKLSKLPGGMQALTSAGYEFEQPPPRQ